MKKIYSSNDFSLEMVGRKAQLKGMLPVCSPKITLIFKSGRNQNCPRLSDVSDRKSKSFIVPPKSEHEVWLPVVDVVITPSTKARVGFSNQDDVDGAINGHLYPENFHAREELIIQSNQLIDWENYLYLKQGNVDVNYFWLEQSFPHIPSLSKNFSCEFEFLTQNWYGEIEICMEENQKQTSIGTITIPKPEIVESTINEENILKHENIMHALKGCIQYILNSRVSSVNNPSKGGFYLFYDWDAQTYRNSFWPWGWGPAINALLNASKEEEITETFDKEKLIKTAWEAGRISLKYRIKNPGHETDGLSTTRFDPNATMPNGMRERICTCADGGFLCGWAWMPLFEFTGDEEFLEAGEDYAKKLKEILDVYGLPPQDYATELSKFTEHTLDESGFGTEALAALWNIKKDETIQQLCTRYMDIHTEKFLREDGLWQRQYHRSCDTTEDCVCMTRGLGWAMEGLLATHRVVKDKTECYLEQAKKMAEVLMKYQQPDGSWNHLFNQSKEDVGIEEKGVALWSLLFYKLYHFTKDTRHLNAARRALSWCMENQIFTNEKSEVYGGIFESSVQSAIVYRKWYKMACLYASGFFALALMEELHL